MLLFNLIKMCENHNSKSLIRKRFGLDKNKHSAIRTIKFPIQKNVVYEYVKSTLLLQSKILFSVILKTDRTKRIKIFQNL